MAKSLLIQENYQTVMPYLILEDATALLTFTKQVFNVDELSKIMKDEKTIMHGEIMIGG